MSRRSFKNAPGFFFLRAGGRTVLKCMRSEDIFRGIPARPHARINTVYTLNTMQMALIVIEAVSPTLFVGSGISGMETLFDLTSHLIDI